MNAKDALKYVQAVHDMRGVMTADGKKMKSPSTSQQRAQVTRLCQVDARNSRAPRARPSSAAKLNRPKMQGSSLRGQQGSGALGSPTTTERIGSGSSRSNSATRRNGTSNAPGSPQSTIKRIGSAARVRPNSATRRGGSDRPPGSPHFSPKRIGSSSRDRPSSVTRSPGSPRNTPPKHRASNSGIKRASSTGKHAGIGIGVASSGGKVASSTRSPLSVARSKVISAGHTPGRSGTSNAQRRQGKVAPLPIKPLSARRAREST